jgi:hypothetical protein
MRSTSEPNSTATRVPLVQPLGRAASFGLDGRFGAVALFRHDVSTEPSHEELALSVVSFPDSPLARARPDRRFGMLGTFPPTPCGVATFSAALADGLVADGAHVGVVRLGGAAPCGDPRVIQQLEAGSPASLLSAARALNAFVVAIVQHVFFFFGGADGL